MEDQREIKASSRKSVLTYTRIRAALHSIGLTRTYLDKFERLRLDDKGVNVYLKYPDKAYLRKPLEVLVSNEEHRSRFLEAYLNVQRPSTSIQSLNYSTLNMESSSNEATEIIRTDAGVDVDTSIVIIETENPQQRPQMEPVLILELTPKLTTPPGGIPQNPDERLEFHSDALKGILSKAEGRPVAVITLVGPSRLGKSFTLNYIIRYLKSRCINYVDWMGDQTQPLNGFPWRNGLDRVTIGIWMWPEPFTVKQKDGTEIAVLLIDAQSIFDDNSEKEDWATILGLSILTSSHLIINASHDIHENNFTFLKEFMDFGLTIEEHHFQQLSFLIRDWCFPDEFPYGAEGGLTFLEKNLNSQRGRKQIAIRKQIKESFQQLSCFLLPDPGTKAKRHNYNGSVEGMCPEFARNLQQYIESIFDSATLCPKTVSKNILTGEDLVHWFEEYVKIFQSYELPSKDVMYGTTVRLVNQSVVRKSFGLYKNEIAVQIARGSTSENKFLLDEKLHRYHEIAKEKAFELFYRSNKLGSQDIVDNVGAEILELINHFFQAIAAENSRKQVKALDYALPQTESFFAVVVEEKTALACCKSPDDFVDGATFTSIYNECYVLTRNLLLNILSLTSSDFELLPRDVLKRIDKCFTDMKETAQLTNKIRFEEAEEQLNKLIASLSSIYARDLSIEIAKFKLWPLKELLKVDAKLRFKCINEFSMKYSNSILFPKGKEKLACCLFEEFKKARKMVELKNEK